MAGKQKIQCFPIVTFSVAVVTGAAIATIYFNKNVAVTEVSREVLSSAYSDIRNQKHQVAQFTQDSDGNYRPLHTPSPLEIVQEVTNNYSGIDDQEKEISNLTKFRACEKTPEVFRDRGGFRGADLVTGLRGFKENNCIHVLKGTAFSSRTYATENNGFVNTVLRSYNKHHNLVIRPDDIWTAILTQFSFYINGNSEEFRKQFVAFEGKRTLEVSLPGTLYNAPYDLFIKFMTKEIDKNILDKEMKDWILPNFSTTTEDDVVTNGAIFMATMKNYFNYRFGTLCGIPWITLEGTVEDWQEILRRSEKLKSYKLENWYNMLKPILKEFVKTKQGKINLSFYQRICHKGGVSGPPYISGWITAFCVFNSQGVWVANKVTKEDPWPIIKIDKIPSGVVEADVTIVDISGTEHNSVLFAGHLGYEVLEDNTTLKPRTGWALALKEGSKPNNT